MDYLLFRLYGPMASWGEIAVGEIRHTASYPGKSAIIVLNPTENDREIQFKMTGKSHSI
jgi:CRISPR-associated Cas5-like protein